MTWRNHAACLDEDPELFFPVGNTDPAIFQIEKAKVVCRRCEVVETCLKWALETRQDAGVWGGLSADERRALRRRNARARRSSELASELPASHRRTQTEWTFSSRSPPDGRRAPLALGN